MPSQCCKMGDDENTLLGPRSAQSGASLGVHFVSCLTRHGEKVAQVQQVGGRVESRTFSQLLVQGKRVAGFLRERGLGSGDTVWISCGNTLAYTPIMLGTLFIGAAVAPVLHLSDASDMLHMLQVIEPKLVIFNATSADALSDAVSQLGRVVDMISLNAVVEVTERDEDVSDFHLAHIEDPANHVALVMGSSGTSGKPKGVELTHAGFLTQANYPFYSDKDEATLQQKVVMNLSYPSWNTAQMSIMATLSNGMKLVLLENFTVENFLNTVQQFRVNYAFLKPPEMTALAKWQDTELYDASSLRNITYGGAPLSRAVVETAQTRLNTKLFSLYGMTETMGILIPPYDVTEMAESLGKLYTNVDCKVVDVETGRVLGPNCEGELCFRTASMMKGYRRNPAATRDVLDEDGFYHSGDLGYFDRDGYLHFVDRIKELIKYTKYQLSAVDIEEVLLGHACVLEAAVVGIPHEADTERATAFVVLRAGSTVSARELASLVEAKLPSYKWLHGGVYLVDSLPRTSTGKLLKRILRARQAQ